MIQKPFASDLSCVHDSVDKLLCEFFIVHLKLRGVQMAVPPFERCGIL